LVVVFSEYLAGVLGEGLLLDAGVGGLEAGDLLGEGVDVGLDLGLRGTDQVLEVPGLVLEVLGAFADPQAQVGVVPLDQGVEVDPQVVQLGDLCPADCPDGRRGVAALPVLEVQPAVLGQRVGVQIPLPAQVVQLR
jgi:hypothetical protein